MGNRTYIYVLIIIVLMPLGLRGQARCYYPLTGCEDTTADDIWLAYQLHRPADGSGVVVAFRREESPHSSIRVKLSGLDPGADYIVEDFDREGARLRTGCELAEGFELTLTEPRSSLLLKYRAR